MIQFKGVSIVSILSNLKQCKSVYAGNHRVFPSDATITGYGDWSIILTPESYSFPSTAGTYDFTAIASRDIYWSNNTTTKDIITDETLFTWSIEGDGFSINSSNGVVSITENPNTTTRTGAVTVSYNGATDTSTVSLSGSEEVIEYGSWLLDGYILPTNINYNDTTIYAYSKCYRQVITKVAGQITNTTIEYDIDPTHHSVTYTTPITNSTKVIDLDNYVKHTLTIELNTSEQDRLISIQLNCHQIVKELSFTLGGVSSLTVSPLLLTWSASEWESKDITITTDDSWSATMS